MPRIRTRTFRARRTPNRAWTGLEDTAVITAASTKTLFGSLNLSNTNIDETVLRTVGILSVHSDQVIASEGQEGAFGMIVVNDRAIASGVAAIPGPISDIEDDGWFVHVPFIEAYEFQSAVGVNSDHARNYKFDFKSKRIVEDGFAIAIIGQTGANSNGVTMTVILRMLTMVRGTG